MSRPISVLTDFRRAAAGATAIEYALIAGGIFLAIIPAVAMIADEMSATYKEIMGYFFSI